MSSINEQQQERGSREPMIANSQLRERVELGRQAELILENPAYTAAWNALRRSIHDAWKDTATTDTQRMQLLHAQVRMVDSLQSIMGQLVNGGKDAQARLKERVAKVADQERNEGLVRRNLRAVMTAAGGRG